MYEKVLCPYCGTEMRFVRSLTSHFYKCDNCLSFSPCVLHKLDDEEIRAAAQKATELALNRYEPMQKPLEWEDATGADYCYIEFFHSGILDECVCLGAVWDDGDLVDVLRFGCGDEDTAAYPVEGYKKTWRCWERKPSEDERAAAKWEDA